MKVLVFIGPSGVGKSTLIGRLRSRGVIELIPSWTTRPPRADETGENLDHHFVTDDAFDELAKAGYFIDTVEMFGFRYGLPAIVAPRGDTVPAIMVRAPLLDLVAKYFPEHVVYQIGSDLDTARARLEARGASRSEIEARLAGFEEELTLGRQRSTRQFDTSDPSLDPLVAIRQAIAEDFAFDRGRSSSGNEPARLMPHLEARPWAGSKNPSLSQFISVMAIVVAVVVGLGTVAYFLLAFVAMASFGSNK
jgi:guanylate kinase